MRSLLNQHSYILPALVLLFFALLSGLAVRPLSLKALLFGGTLVLLFSIPLLWRRGPGDVVWPEAVESALQSGHPTLLFFYSDY